MYNGIPRRKTNGKKQTFCPTHFDDFDKDKWYSVLTSKNVTLNEEAAFWAHIGRIDSKFNNIVSEYNLLFITLGFGMLCPVFI